MSNTNTQLVSHVCSRAIQGIYRKDEVGSVSDNTSNTSQGENPSNSSSGSNQASIATGGDAVFAILHGYCTYLGFKMEDRESVLLPDNWNAVSDSYSIKYSHDRSSLSFVLKAVVLADKFILHCVAVEDGAVHSLELSLAETLNLASFPIKFTPPESCLARSMPVLTSDENPFLPVFKDAAVGLENILFRFKTSIVDKVAPNLNKDGYEPVSSDPAVSNTQAGSSTAERRGEYDGPRGGGFVGGIPDPAFGNRGYRPIRPPFAGEMGGYGTGDVDLDPFSAAPGLIPPRGGLGVGGMHPGGGMFVGPDHPMFGGGSSGMGGYGGGGGSGVYGGPGSFLPVGAVPPNARFDPIGPFGPRPMGGMRGGFGGDFGNPYGGGGGGFPGGGGGFGGGRGRGGGPGGYRMGPDNDEMPPPGFEDDMYS